MTTSPSILEAIDSHAYMAQAYRRLARGRRTIPLDRERFLSHSQIAATLAVDQAIASPFEISNLKSEIRKEAA